MELMPLVLGSHYNFCYWIFLYTFKWVVIKDDLDVFVPSIYLSLSQISRLMPLVAHCDFLLTLLFYLLANVMWNYK